MRLIDLFHDYYRPLRLRGRSPATTKLYGCCIRAYGRYLDRDPTVADLDELLLAKYLEHRAGQVAALTAEKERTQLVALAGLAFERRLIEIKPTVPPAPIPDRVPVAWTLDELRRLLAAAADPATFVSRNGRPPLFRRPGAAAPQVADDHRWRARFFKAIVPTLWESGERVGAMLEVEIADYQRPHLLVRGEARKGRKRDRLYRLTAGTCGQIDELLDGRTDGLVFDWGLTRTYLWREFGRVVRAAGLDGRRVSFHQIRRSAASHYAAAGGDPCQMLDHSSPRITARWYLDPRVADRSARPCDILPPISAAAR
jgi:integrase